MTTLDYAQVFETQIRPARRLSRRLRQAGAWTLWTALLLVRPRTALQILQAR